MLGKIEGRRRRGWQRMRWLDGITDSMDIIWVNSGSWWWAGRGLACCSPWGFKELDTTERLNWTQLSTEKNRSKTILGEILWRKFTIWGLVLKVSCSMFCLQQYKRKSLQQVSPLVFHVNTPCLMSKLFFQELQKFSFKLKTNSRF